MARHNLPRRQATTCHDVNKTMLLLVFGFVLNHAGLSRAAETTNGPLATLSIWEGMEYKTARACAQGCLQYNGVLPCNVQGYYDLGVELGCGRCGPINACYCSSGLASSATSYLSACVSRGCAKSVSNWEEEANNMLSIYDGYCATANVAAATTTTPKTTRTPGATGAASDAGTATQTGPTSSATETSSGGAESNGGGLSQSTIVALAVGLGVGIPGITIAALIACCVMFRRKRKARTARKAAEGAATTPQFQQPPPPQYQSPAPYGHPGGLAPSAQELSGQHFAGQMPVNQRYDAQPSTPELGGQQYGHHAGGQQLGVQQYGGQGQGHELGAQQIHEMGYSHERAR